jgi:replicative DNA helicase
MNDYQIPHDTALELHILGSMIYEPECIGEVVEIVKSLYFYHSDYKKLFEAIVDIWKNDPKDVSFAVLVPVMQKNNIALDNIMNAVTSIHTVADIQHNSQRLKDIAALREAVKAAQEVIGNAGIKDGQDIRLVIANAESKLSKITNDNIQTSTMKTVREVMMDFNEHFEKLYYNADASGITGLASGFKDLDKMTAGFQKADLIILAARPSVGKTALMLQIAKNMSAESDGEVVVFSLEMATLPLASRMLSSEANIDANKLRTGLIEIEEWERYTMGISSFSEKKLMIDEQSGLTVTEMKAKCRKIQRENGISAIFVDYLGLIKGDKSLSRYDLVSENTRELKNMAKEFNVPVICLCQLSRSVEQRQDKRPGLSDLRESGEIEQTADVVALLYRDDYYDKESEKKNIIEVIIAKQRNGATGTVELAFLKNYSKFASLDYGHGTEVTKHVPSAPTNRPNRNNTRNRNG